MIKKDWDLVKISDLTKTALIYRQHKSYAGQSISTNRKTNREKKWIMRENKNCWAVAYLPFGRAEWQWSTPKSEMRLVKHSLFCGTVQETTQQINCPAWSTAQHFSQPQLCAHCLEGWLHVSTAITCYFHKTLQSYSSFLCHHFSPKRNFLLFGW